VPVPGVEITIHDIEDGSILPRDVIGEIRVRGWSVFGGYFNMAGETDAAFDEDKRLRTGDLGRIDASGMLFLEGRIKRMIKTGGENVSEREVEMFLEDNLGIVLAQVVGVPDPVWGEAVVAFVQVEKGVAADEEKIKRGCKGRIAGYKIPKKIFFMDENDWPRSGVGKISKDKLVQQTAGRI